MRSLFWVLPGMLLFLIYCSSNNLAGGSTDTELGGTKVVAGIINNPDGTPAAGTGVRLIVDKYNPLKDGMIPDSLTFMTKSDGRYCIRILDSGLFNIEATDPARNLRALKNDVWVSKDTVHAGSLTLTRPGAVRVTLPDSADLTKGYLFVPGTGYYKHLARVPIVLVNAKRFVVFDSLPADTLPAICYDREQSVGSSVTVLNNPVIISDDTISTTKIIESWEIIHTGNSKIPENNINTVVVDKAGKLWVGTETRGCAVYNKISWKIYDTTANFGLIELSNRVVSLLDGNDGCIWVGTDSGLARFDEVSWTINSALGGAVPRYEIKDLAVDNSGIEFVLSSREYIKYTGTVWYKKVVKTTSVITGLTCLVVDRQNRIIFGSTSGLYTLDLPDTTTYKKIPVGNLSPDKSLVEDIAVDADNGIWCATSYGIYHYNSKDWQVFDSTDLAIPGNRITCVTVDHNNFVWAGLQDSGCVVRLGGFAKVFTATNTAALKNVGAINEIIVTDDNTLYIATKQGGLLKLTYSLDF
jgi:streptogramin lyase